MYITAFVDPTPLHMLYANNARLNKKVLCRIKQEKQLIIEGQLKYQMKDMNDMFQNAMVTHD